MPQSLLRRNSLSRPRLASRPILDHPGASKALIEPAELHQSSPRVPQRMVLTFFHNVLQERAASGALEKIGHLVGEGPEIPIYRTTTGEPEVGVCWAGLTAPLAAACLEELIAMGGRAFLCCGGAGALEGKKLAAGHLVIPHSAVRQEGTSYHYQQSGRLSYPHPAALRALQQACDQRGIPYVTGKTWTTDGVFRETPPLIRRRRDEGCLTVEMEAAALFAVAKFRHVVFGQVLYAADDVGGDVWDSRGWRSLLALRRGLVDLCTETLRNMSVEP